MSPKPSDSGSRNFGTIGQRGQLLALERILAGLGVLIEHQPAGELFEQHVSSYNSRELPSPQQRSVSRELAGERAAHLLSQQCRCACGDLGCRLAGQ